MFIMLMLFVDVVVFVSKIYVPVKYSRPIAFLLLLFTLVKPQCAEFNGISAAICKLLHLHGCSLLLTYQFSQHFVVM